MNKYIDPLNNVRKKIPVIQCITNFVTVNDCANAILASGGSPSMAQDIREVEESVCNVNALVCNMGAIDFVDSMILAGKKANTKNIPVVLDPVAAGGTELRRNSSKKLLEEVHFTAIRGNASEIFFLAGQNSMGSGVDVSIEDVITRENCSKAINLAKNLAKKLKSIIAISGELDIVTDGDQSIILSNGCRTMSRITGSGCMLTSIIGAFCGAMPKDPFDATVSAMATMGVAGEIAEKKRLKNKTGNATFRTDLIDAIFNMTEEQLKENIKYEIYKV